MKLVDKHVEQVHENALLDSIFAKEQKILYHLRSLIIAVCS